MKQHLEQCENYKRKQAKEGKSESAAHVVLAFKNHGIDSYWKQLGTESNGEDARPELSPEQKDALAMSDLLRIRHR
jgi:arabinogalactan endo-1,4-beta-galactosidase